MDNTRRTARKSTTQIPQALRNRIDRTIESRLNATGNTRLTARKSTTQIPEALRNRLNQNRENQSNATHHEPKVFNFHHLDISSPAKGSNRTQSSEGNIRPKDKQPNAGSNDKQSK